MTYKIRTINTSQHIICFDNITNQGLQYALVETNVKDVKAFNEESKFSTLLIDSIKVLPNNLTASSFPKKLADSIEEVITNRYKSYPYLFHVSYVGIALKNSMVYVCSAGNNRVHLIKNNKTLASTRDHNLIDDAVNGFESNPNFPIREGDRYVETRQIVALKSEKKHSAECFTWKANGNFTILVCSYSLHRFRKPEEYLQSFLNSDEGIIIKDKSFGGGIITKIDYLANN